MRCPRAFFAKKAKCHPSPPITKFSTHTHLHQEALTVPGTQPEISYEAFRHPPGHPTGLPYRAVARAVPLSPQ